MQNPWGNLFTPAYGGVIASVPQQEQRQQETPPAPARPLWEIDPRVTPRYDQSPPTAVANDRRIYPQMSQAQMPIPVQPQHRDLPLGTYGTYAPNPYAVGAADPNQQPPPSGIWKWVFGGAAVLGVVGGIWWWLGKEETPRANEGEENEEENE